MIVGITGHIGVGKSTAAKLFEQHGFRVIEVDSMGHTILEDPEIKNKLLSAFGDSVFDHPMKVNRKKLGDLAFDNPEKLETLNSIMHPVMKKYMISLLNSLKGTSHDYVMDVALLSSFGLEAYCDYIVLIKADMDLVYERMTKGYTKKHILNLTNKQLMPKKPDFEILNNKSREEFESAMLDVISSIKRKA